MTLTYLYRKGWSLDGGTQSRRLPRWVTVAEEAQLRRLRKAHPRASFDVMRLRDKWTLALYLASRDGHVTAAHYSVARPTLRGAVGDVLRRAGR